jgi:hypothetical protein
MIFVKKLKRFTMPFQCSMIALAVIGTYPSYAVAQDVHAHKATEQEAEMTLEQQAAANTLLKIVRDSTEKYQDVKVAEAQGYALQFGCVTGDDAGAMGLHYVNGDLVKSGVLDPTRPQIVIYEPTANGLKLIGADFLIFADAWNAAHTDPPQLMGQLFHLFPSPNRFLLPAFYTLHVWAWKQNPQGTFVNWHPHVSCATFTAPRP